MPVDDGKTGIEELKKELLRNIEEPDSEPQWLTMYKELSEFPVTIFFAEQFVRVNYVHLTLGLLRDNDIIMRELLQKNVPDNSRYILSFAECDEKYKAIIAEHARSIFVQTYESIDTSNTIWKLFAKYTLRYLGMKIQLCFSPDGKFGVEVVSSDE